MARFTASIIAGTGLMLAALLTGCAASVGAEPAPTTSTGSVAPSAPVEPDAVAPELVPDGSAADNLPYFDATVATVLAAEPNPGGRAYIDALAGAGFDKTQMEVTFDTTHVDLAVDAVQFSVRLNGECLIGQNGPSSGGYHSMVAPPFSTGTCLIGSTRQIDW